MRHPKRCRCFSELSRDERKLLAPVDSAADPPTVADQALLRDLVAKAGTAPRHGSTLLAESASIF
jgi:hypothetical protein